MSYAVKFVSVSPVLLLMFVLSILFLSTEIEYDYLLYITLLITLVVLVNRYILFQKLLFVFALTIFIFLNALFINPSHIETRQNSICGVVSNIAGNRIKLFHTQINQNYSTRFIYVKTTSLPELLRYQTFCFSTDQPPKKYQRYDYVFEIKDDQITEVGNFQMAYYVEQLSSYINTTLDRYFESNAGLAKALIFGIKDDLDLADKKSFQEIGVSHLLVASGANILIIIYVVNLAARGVKKMFNLNFSVLLVELAVVMIYLLVLGLEGSITRAFIFWIFLVLERMVGRKILFIHKFIYCFALLVLFFPENLYSIGLYLSMAALVGINLGNDICKYFSLENEYIKVIVINILIVLCTSIITAYYFAEVNFTGIISNIFIIPLGEILIGVGFALSLICLVLGIFQIEFFDFIMMTVLSLYTVCIESLKGLVYFVQNMQLPQILNVKFYLSFQQLIVAIIIVLLLWFLIKIGINTKLQIDNEI